MRAYIRLIASLHAPIRQGFRTFLFLLASGGTFSPTQQNKYLVALAVYKSCVEIAIFKQKVRKT